MTDTAIGRNHSPPRAWHQEGRAFERLRKRKASETRFKAYGMIAIFLGIAFLAVLFTSIVSKGYTAFQQTYIALDIKYDPEVLGIGSARDTETLAHANYAGLIKQTLAQEFPDVSGRVLSGQSPVAESESLSAEQCARERLVFGLRRLEGVDGRVFAESTGFTIQQLVGSALLDYCQCGWLTWVGDRLQLTDEGLMFSDAIWPDFI